MKLPYRALIRSLRFRLTAWFTGALALLLLFLAALLVFGAWHTLRAETDTFLIREAQRVTSADEAETEGSTSQHSPDPSSDPDLAYVISSYRPIPSEQHRHNHLKSFLVFDVVYLRLFDAAGHKAVATSPSLSKQPLLLSSLDTLKLPRDGAVAPQIDFASPNEEQAMRVLTETVQIGQKPLVLQIAVPWDHNADALERLELLLAITLPLILFAAAVGGWVLVGRALLPIQRIVAEAKELDVNAPPKQLLPAPAETDSEIGHLVATLNSMTTRLHQAFQAQRGFAEAQQRFAADSSHELRTPLTILRGEMELALTRPRSPEAYQATIASGIEEIVRMSRIVESLSFLARHDASQIQSSRIHTTLDLSCIVSKAITDFEPQAREKQIVLNCDSELCPALVLGDEVQLQQLVCNLIDNAVKYTASGGRISVSVVVTDTGSEKSCRVTVEDTGVGIEEKDLPHVFERFWQADLARTAGGSGLGLAICQQIIHLHSGEIRVRSKVGQGTAVEFELPAL